MRRISKKLFKKFHQVLNVLKKSPKDSSFIGLFFFLAFGFTLLFSGQIINLLKRKAPFLLHLTVDFPDEILLNSIKLALFAGCYFTIPVIVRRLDKFYPKKDFQKFKTTFNYLFISSIIGILFGYFVLIPAKLFVLLGFSLNFASVQINISKFISFCIGILLFSSLIFQIPTIIYLKNKNQFYSYQEISPYKKQLLFWLIFASSIVFLPPFFMSFLFYLIGLYIFYKILLFMVKVNITNITK